MHSTQLAFNWETVCTCNYQVSLLAKESSPDKVISILALVLSIFIILANIPYMQITMSCYKIP